MEMTNRERSIDLVLIAAIAENGVIGDGDDIPWDYPEDMAHFREVTTEHPVIMGRRTYESIAAKLGGPLPNRTNIVMSTGDLNYSGIEVAGSIDEAVEAAANATETGQAFVAGGAIIYEQFLQHADRLLLTEIPGAYEGDTTFPEWDSNQWAETERTSRGDVAVVKYQRTVE